MGLGPGPVWPVGFGATGRQPLGESADGVWHAVKVLWAASPAYQGPILVRGGRIDAEGAVRFSLNGPVGGEEELERGAGQTPPVGRTWPSYTLVQGPGCYAFQIDGTSFSYSVVFEVGG